MIFAKRSCAVRIFYFINLFIYITKNNITDFEASIRSSVEKEELYKKEINESKMIIIGNARENEHLTEV